MKKENSRTSLISWLAYMHGGHNAGGGSGWGRLGLCVDTEDDEAIARYFQKEITNDAQIRLKKENAELKAEIYDLNKRIEKIKSCKTQS